MLFLKPILIFLLILLCCTDNSLNSIPRDSQTDYLPLPSPTLASDIVYTGSGYMLTWNRINDSAVRGYNVYVDSAGYVQNQYNDSDSIAWHKVNSELITDTTYIIDFTSYDTIITANNDTMYSISVLPGQHFMMVGNTYYHYFMITVVDSFFRESKGLRIYDTYYAYQEELEYVAIFSDTISGRICIEENNGHVTHFLTLSSDTSGTRIYFKMDDTADVKNLEETCGSLKSKVREVKDYTTIVN